MKNSINKFLYPGHLIFFFTLASFLIYLLPVKAQTATTTQAGTIIVSPQVIDENAKAKDVLEYDIKLINNTERKASVYALVYDLAADGTQLNFVDYYNLSKATSLARWISIKRSETDINIGEEIVLPLKIEVNMNAMPGKYHAYIIFSQGPNQPEAAIASLSANQPKLLVNINVEDDVVEKTQLVKFIADKNIFWSYPVGFLLEMKNIGNRPIAPVGSIMIYDRRGQEMENILINENAKPVNTDTSISYLAKTDKNIGIGKFKAKLILEYGDKSKRDIEETVFFWILPWKLAVITLAIIFFLFITLIVLLVKVIGNKKETQLPHDGVINLKSFK